MPVPFFDSIVIVGLGLIGGSLAGACRKAFPKSRIAGVAKTAKTLKTALRKGWIQEGYQNIRTVFSSVGTPLVGAREGRGQAPPRRPFIILCTPIDTFKNFLIQLDRCVPPGTVVTDAGSVKGFIVSWASRQKWKHIHYVGAHPMAGSHEKGLDHARADLFKDALTFVTPARGGDNAVRPVINFWKRICREVAVMPAAEHDRLTAQISHVPHLIASLLVDQVPDKALRFAGSGFRDTTRVAQSDPNLWTSILFENRETILPLLRRFRKQIENFEKRLKAGSLNEIRFLLACVQRRRSRLR